MTEKWQRIENAPEKIVVQTCIDDGDGQRNVADLVREGKLWFFPDRSMYVYYEPTHWQERTEGNLFR